MQAQIESPVRRTLSRTTLARPRLLGSVPERIRVALIEDNRLVREGMTAILNALPDFDVVSGALSTDLSAMIEQNPEVVLLDVGLMNGESLRLTSQVRSSLPQARLIVMDLLPGQEEIIQFVNVGVSGFITKDATLEELADTIRAVAGGLSILPPSMIGTLFTQLARHATGRGRPGATPAAHMTVREGEVIEYIAEGLSNKEIAARLNVTTHTVKSHVGNVLEKLAMRSRLQIAAYAHSSR